MSQRRELAQLLDNGREASARIRVENVIANDIAVEVMEMVELYCELLLARAPVLDQIAFADKGARGRNKAKENIKGIERGESATDSPGSSRLGLGFSRLGRSSTPEKEKAKTEPRDEEDDDYIDPGLDEAAAAIFYAWPRFPREVRELTTLRSLLIDRWGKDFATLAQDNKASVKVPERLAKRLRVKPPSTDLVESYLREIAKAYGVAWPREGEEVAEGDIPEPMDREYIRDDQQQPPPPDTPDENDGDGDVAAAPVTPQKKPVNLADIRRASEAEELSRATPPRDIGPHDVTGKSPVSVAPPKPSTDNPNPRVRIPGETGSMSKNAAASTVAKSPPAAATRPVAPQRKDSKGIPDVDELSKRFAALKR